MSLPPDIVHLKRKRNEEPVETLCVQESNGKQKRRLTAFIFKRQVEPLDHSTSVSATEPGSTCRTKQLRTSATSHAVDTQEILQSQTKKGAGVPESKEEQQTKDCQLLPTNNELYQPSQDVTPDTPLSKKHQPRRFHISRITPTAAYTTSVVSGRVQKHKQPTVFVERRIRAGTLTTGPLPPSTSTPAQEPAQAPAQKKPGQSARTSAAISNRAPVSSASRFAPNPRGVRLPSGLVAPWSLDDQQLVEEMQRYTLQEIGHSIAEATAPKPGVLSGSIQSKKPSRFKPTVPKIRYHERHPEEFADQDNGMKVEQFIEEVDDDSEYIIDTYVRIPADVMELDTDAEKNVGLLVLDGQDDIDEFYSAETESDEDEDYDEEDENAENHYSADYPDEEVESDDEYGRNPYQYAKEDGTFSDESDAGTKYPWTKKPAWLRKMEGGIDYRDDDDDDDEDEDD